MSDYKKIFNKKTKKEKPAEAEVTNDLVEASEEELLAMVKPKEKEEVPVIKPEEPKDTVRTAIDIYFDKAVNKYMKIEITYEENSGKILSLTKTKATANLAIELHKVHDHFTNKIFKRR